MPFLSFPITTSWICSILSSRFSNYTIIGNAISAMQSSARPSRQKYWTFLQSFFLIQSLCLTPLFLLLAMEASCLTNSTIRYGAPLLMKIVPLSRIFPKISDSFTKNLLIHKCPSAIRNSVKKATTGSSWLILLAETVFLPYLPWMSYAMPLNNVTL